MFRRSDSFTSICSCSTDPPEISLEDEDISLESYQQVDSYQELGEYSIPVYPELGLVQQPTHRIINFSHIYIYIYIYAKAKLNIKITIYHKTLHIKSSL